MEDTYEVHVRSSFIPIFWCLAGLSIILLYFSLGYAKQYTTIAAFLLTPMICVSLIFDNVIMATTGIDRRRVSTQVMLAFHACVMPMLLLVCYELAYLVHKHKSVNFCGILFERGRGNSSNNTGTASTQTKRRALCLRIMVWLVSCVLLVLNLLVAYHWTADLSPEVTSLYEIQGDSSAHAVSAILPALVLVLLALYVGLQLWNYGTNYSYMVYATCFNPWIWMLVGALALLVGYLMPSPIYALSSNAGEVIMMATIVRTFREVHQDMQQGLEFGDFIAEGTGTVGRRLPEPLNQDVRRMSLSLSKSANQSKTAADQSLGYMVVSTPKVSELPITFANRIGHNDQEKVKHSERTAYLSVIVPQER